MSQCKYRKCKDPEIRRGSLRFCQLRKSQQSPTGKKEYVKRDIKYHLDCLFETFSGDGDNENQAIIKPIQIGNFYKKKSNKQYFIKPDDQQKIIDSINSKIFLSLFEIMPWKKSILF